MGDVVGAVAGLSESITNEIIARASDREDKRDLHDAEVALPDVATTRSARDAGVIGGKAGNLLGGLGDLLGPVPTPGGGLGLLGIGARQEGGAWRHRGGGLLSGVQDDINGVLTDVDSLLGVK